MFSMVLLNIFINYPGEDANSTFIKLVGEAKERGVFKHWGRG